MVCAPAHWDPVADKRKIMNERPADKLWKDMTPQQVDHFFKLLAKRAEDQDDLAYKTMVELTKYLFATNTGAAAGIFFLLRSSPDQLWYLLSFFIFCGGTFFVGICYLTLSSWSGEIADGWSQDVNAWSRNEMTITDMDINSRTRHSSWKKAGVRWGLRISFILLIAGGLMAGFSIWKISH